MRGLRMEAYMKAKRWMSGMMAMVASVSCLSMMTACQTSHPKVQMEITFENKSYVLDYTLYRKVAPATVEHFLTLAGNGYYDGVIVHDYNTSRMYTGAYEYGDASVDNGLKYKNYYDIVSKYTYFPTSVYTQGKGQALYTLCGEFKDNHVIVKNGEKKETFGSLTMFYTEKAAEMYTVTVKHPEAGEGDLDYKYNSATSMFFISLNPSQTTTNSNYCTFATLNEGSKAKLEALQDAIDEYLEGNENAVEETEMYIDQDDPFVGVTNKKTKYDVLNEPITIKKVTIKSR